MKVIRVVGGLASQMSAVALAMAVQKNSENETVIADFSAYHNGWRYDHNGAQINEVFHLTEESVGPYLSRILLHNALPYKVLRRLLMETKIYSRITAAENGFDFDGRVFHPSKFRLTELCQCWTSWRYFQDIEGKIREVYKFPSITNGEGSHYRNMILNENAVGIHIRRGDYVGHSTLGNLIPLEYYAHAAEVVKTKVSDPYFFIFSDDPIYAEQKVLPLINDCNVEVVAGHSGEKSWIDMALMSKCRHQIIANSGFGWWAAYLAQHQNQVVIAPKKWVSRASGIRMNEMNLPGWTVLDNELLS